MYDVCMYDVCMMYVCMMYGTRATIEGCTNNCCFLLRFPPQLGAKDTSPRTDR